MPITQNFIENANFVILVDHTHFYKGSVEFLQDMIFQN